MNRPPPVWLIASIAFASTVLPLKAASPAIFAQLAPDPGIAVSVAGAIAFLALIRRRRRS